MMPYKDPNCPAAIASRKRRDKKYYEAHKEEIRKRGREYGKDYYKKNKEAIDKKCKKYYEENKEKFKVYRRKWRKNNPEKAKESLKKSTKKWREKNPNHYIESRKIRRLKVLTHYGGNPPRCAHCGETIYEFLTIDHIHGGGKRHRKKISNNTYRWLINNNFLKGFQVLCYNCNFLKEYPKEKISYQQKYILKTKLKILGHYSNGALKCACCDESRIGCLAIDHIAGDGRKHRKKLGNKGGFAFYLWLKRNGFPDGYRVLCHNCNSSFGLYGYCPHNKKCLEQ